MRHINHLQPVFIPKPCIDPLKAIQQVLLFRLPGFNIHNILLLIFLTFFLRTKQEGNRSHFSGSLVRRNPVWILASRLGKYTLPLGQTVAKKWFMSLV